MRGGAPFRSKQSCIGATEWAECQSYQGGQLAWEECTCRPWSPPVWALYKKCPHISCPRKTWQMLRLEVTRLSLAGVTCRHPWGSDSQSASRSSFCRGRAGRGWRTPGGWPAPPAPSSCRWAAPSQLMPALTGGRLLATLGHVSFTTPLHSPTVRPRHQ